MRILVPLTNASFVFKFVISKTMQLIFNTNLCRGKPNNLNKLPLEVNFTFQVLYTSLFEMNYNLYKKQVNETVLKKIINLILIKKYLRPYFDRQPGNSLFIIIYKTFILIKKQMNVEMLQWDLVVLGRD
jgi:hypothetical protein